ncbi:MAG: hypothetical protein P8Y70_00145 [Candidatus Lokiarchaeota archaeon]
MIITILLIIGVGSILMNILLIQQIRVKNEIINRKNTLIDKYKRNANLLVKYQDNIETIQEEHAEISNQIKEATTDEEVENIIATIIVNNNQHLHND